MNCKIIISIPVDSQSAGAEIRRSSENNLKKKRGHRHTHPVVASRVAATIVSVTPSFLGDEPKPYFAMAVSARYPSRTYFSVEFSDQLPLSPIYRVARSECPEVKASNQQI